MAAPLHPVRFKGATLGNLSAEQVAERLRSGELSLYHAIEHRGRWMTVRQFLREGSVVPPPPESGIGLLGRLTGKSAAEVPPPPPGSRLVGDSIESHVREGYLWCGLTFVLPLLLGLPIWGLGKVLGIRTAPTTTLLLLAATGGAAYAAWRTHRTSLRLNDEGLDGVGRSMRQLGLALAGASACFWIAIVLLWIAP